MSAIRIHHDGSPLHAAIRLDGGKHAFAHSLACAALAERGTLADVPDHIDARALREGLGLVFESVRYDAARRTLAFAGPRPPGGVRIGAPLAARSRSLFCLLPALLHHAGELLLEGTPTGCDIGERPNAWYFDVLARFGVQTTETDEGLLLRWPERRAAEVDFAYPTMTGTVIAVAAAAAVPGRSVIGNVSAEPSCREQLGCLEAMGGRVRADGDRIVVDGLARHGSVDWLIACDRIHAVTYLTAGLLTRGEVTVTASTPLRIPRFVEFLHAAGARVAEAPGTLTAGFPDARGYLDAVDLRAGSEPRFSSDWVAFAALLLAARSRGTSTITDDVFPRRFQYLDSLRARGLPPVGVETVELAGRTAVSARVTGDPALVLRGGDIEACNDIRGSAALLLAGLAADGACRLDDDFQVRRGYTDLPGDLMRLGVREAAAEREEAVIR